jgi:radical SAM-linked protein
VADYRIEFSKGAEVRFLSHLELMRAFERAIRRAELPIAFSEGFNPHPKMSFSSALAVGVTCDKEYLDLELQQELNAQEVMERLNQSLPPGFKVRRCILLQKKERALMAMVAEASYKVKVSLLSPVTKEVIDEAVDRLLAKESLIIEKKAKKGSKLKEIRPGIFALKCVEANNEWAEFIFTVQAGSEGNIRPEEVLKALTEIVHLPLDLSTLVIHRAGIYTKGRKDLMSVVTKE